MNQSLTNTLNDEQIPPNPEQSPSSSTSDKINPKSKRKSQTKDFFKVKKDVAKVKHGVLKRYLGAWLPILTRNTYRTGGQNFSVSNPQYSRVIYVDGFSGPGKYSDGENGSPIIAYELALGLTGLSSDSPDICLIFIDKDKNKCDTLLKNLNISKSKDDLKEVNVNKVKFMVINGQFVSAMEWILSLTFEFPPNTTDCIFTVPNEVASSIIRHPPFIGKMTPLLVFADPFGYNGMYMPMTLMRDIMNRSEKSEVLVNLMTSGIQRFGNMETRKRPINLLVGNDATDEDWKSIAFREVDAKAKLKEFLEYYHKQLSSGSLNARYSCLFEVRDNQNKLKYNLYYASPHNTGFQKMKDAMRKESQEETIFKYSVFNANNPDFEEKMLTTGGVKELILEEFAGRVVRGSDITTYFERHPHLTQHFRSPLKRELDEYCKTGSKVGKFDTNIYDFTPKETNKERGKVRKNLMTDFFPPKSKE